MRCISILTLAMMLAAGCSVREVEAPFEDCAPPSGTLVMKVRSGPGGPYPRESDLPNVWTLDRAGVFFGFSGDLVTEDGTVVEGNGLLSPPERLFGITPAQTRNALKAAGEFREGVDFKIQRVYRHESGDDSLRRMCGAILEHLSSINGAEYQDRGCLDGGTTTIEAWTSKGHRSASAYCMGGSAEWLELRNRLDDLIDEAATRYNSWKT